MAQPAHVHQALADLGADATSVYGRFSGLLPRTARDLFDIAIRRTYLIRWAGWRICRPRGD
jgi:hypothetical protein